LAGYSAVVGLDLARYGTEADAETIRDTAIAQPLLVASSLAVAADLLPSFDGVGLVAGHSVGELGALALAGVVSPAEALTLVRERGLAMAEASAARPTSMTAVIGGDRDEVLAAIESAGAGVVLRADRFSANMLRAHVQRLLGGESLAAARRLATSTAACRCERNFPRLVAQAVAPGESGGDS